MTVTGEPNCAQRRVLVVEDQAHRPTGHFPTRFAEVAEGFSENGCVVEVLTSQGWLYEGVSPVPFPVNRYGRFNLLLYRAAVSFRTTRGLHRTASVLRTFALVRAARSRTRRAGAPRPDVIVVSRVVDPIVATAFAGGGRWLFYEFTSPLLVWRSFSRRAARAQRRRREGGGNARIATPNDKYRDEWRAIAPCLDPVTLPIAGSRTRERVPDARRRLGLAVGDRVALVFGSKHDEKDVDLVARVFADLGDWQLLLGGRIGESYRQRTGARDAVVVGGFVDDEMRAVLYSAADLVVLSFQPSFQRNSGVLMDALSWGVPVVCSDGSPAAEVVREYRLGVVFDPGNPDSLERAIKLAPASIAPADLERARRELSNRAVAARLLDALQYSPPAEGGVP
jgi:glycosyltransferase involved in cell wall biosynthesis